MVEHVNIVDAQRHEPKGISTATVGQVYVSDGAQSGDWEDAAIAPSNVVVINELADFPTPAGNIITLANDTTYQISGVINLGANRFQLGTSNHIKGNSSSLDKLVTTTTGALFTGVGCRITALSVTASSGSIFDITGGVVSCNLFNILGCVTVGTIVSAGLIAFRNSGCTAVTTTGLSITGTCRTLSIDANTWTNFEGEGIDLNTATFSFINIVGNRFTPNAGATSLVFAPSSANLVGGVGNIDLNLFEGAGTATSGLTPSDLRWAARNNTGLQSSLIVGDGHILGSALLTPIAFVSTPVKVNFGVAFIPDVQSQFTVDNTGTFTFIGETTTNCYITATVFATIAGGATRNYRYYIAVNGVIDIGSVSENAYDGSNPGACNVSAVEGLSTGDTVELWVENITSTTDITIETCSIKMLGT